ncbi:MAG: tyrosine-type recombinase/integrase [Candidatus Bathyarchaeota archaeon]
MLARVGGKPKDSRGLWVATSKSYDFLLGSPAVTQWINSYASSKTRDDYLRCLELVVTKLGKSPEDLLLLNQTEARRAVVSVAQGLVQQEKFTSARQVLTALKGFFEANDQILQLHRQDRVKKIRKKIRYEHIPSSDELYRMVDASPRIRDKAILLCLFQSGVRVGCLSRWTVGLVQPHLFPAIAVPVPLKITNALDTKLSGYGLDYYYTFLGQEAAQALKSYLEGRVSKEGRLRDDDCVFKGVSRRATRGRLHNKYIRGLVKSAAQSIGLDPKTVWTHLLRKSFRKVLNQSELDEDTKESLMGHRLPGSRANYFDCHDTAEIAKKYALCQFGRSPLALSREEIRTEVIAALMGKISNVELAPIAEKLGISPDMVRNMIQRIGEKGSEEETEALLDTERTARTGGHSNNHESRLVTEDELCSYINEGWELVKELSNGKILVKKLTHS